MRPDDGTVDHLHAVRNRFAGVENLQDRLPQPRKRPAPELAINRGPFAEFLGQVSPRRAGAGDPENPVQHSSMVNWLAAVRLTHRPQKRFKERPFRIRHQIPRQDSLQSQSYLESRQAPPVNLEASVRSRSRLLWPHVPRDLIEAGLSEPAGWRARSMGIVLPAPCPRRLIGRRVCRFRSTDRDWRE